MTYTGMNAGSGRAISDVEHIQQSVADILLTPIGSRVMRREYGSLLPDLIDQPINGATRLRAMSAVVTALLRWEPRIQLTRVDFIVNTEPGSVTLTLAATLTTGPRAGQAVSLMVPLKGVRQ
jgi:phage baseplate assembly protein W